MTDFQKIGSAIGLPNHMQINQPDEQYPNDLSKMKTYTVLVNPKSYGVTYKACYKKDQGMQSVGTTYHLNNVKSQSMNIELLFDATGSLGKGAAYQSKSVLEQINAFLEVAFIPHEEDIKGKELQIIWGDMRFYGVLETISVDYTHFDQLGNPIRATAACTFDGGTLAFEKKTTESSDEVEQPVAVKDEKHGVNALLKYGSYISLLRKQVGLNRPKSLRLINEIKKMRF